MLRMYNKNLEALKDMKRPEPAVSMTIFLLSFYGYLKATQNWANKEYQVFCYRSFSLPALEQIFGKFYSNCLNNSCQLNVEWIWNFLPFFGPHNLWHFLWKLCLPIFQLFGHFMPTQYWVDAQCPQWTVKVLHLHSAKCTLSILIDFTVSGNSSNCKVFW